MTQVFADDDQVGNMEMLPRGVQIPKQATHRVPLVHGPAMTPGKGVRRIRCVGCARDTLPRTDDGAPLCQRCSELLASDSAAALAVVAWPTMARTPRWLRRRPTL
jgi:hypothetical protein